ncbi:MAG TPA: hypothetical protein VM554_06640 [Acidisarcina sp.]|nr:hypothetical protein [Acidisarcina sp.]
MERHDFSPEKKRATQPEWLRRPVFILSGGDRKCAKRLDFAWPGDWIPQISASSVSREKAATYTINFRPESEPDLWQALERTHD